MSTLVAALLQSSSVNLLHEPQAMKSVQAHLCKLSSVSFVVTAVLSSGTDGGASKPNVTAVSVLSFARVADCSKYAKKYAMQSQRQLCSLAVPTEVLHSLK